MTPLPPDPTLDELRAALAPLVARNAAFDGWTMSAVDAAGESLGVDAGVARLAFPDGPVDMIDAWFASIDAESAASRAALSSASRSALGFTRPRASASRSLRIRIWV